MSSNPCNYMDYGGGDRLNGKQAAYGWLVIGQPVVAGLAYGLQDLRQLSL